MLLYCKSCKQKVDINPKVLSLSHEVTCPQCGSRIFLSTESKDKTTLKEPFIDNEEKDGASFRKLITRLFVVFVFLVAILIVLLLHPKTSNYTKNTLTDIFESTASKITGKKYIQRSALDLFAQGEKLYNSYTYAALKEANILYQKAYREDREFIEAHIAEAETYAIIGRLSSDTRLIRKSLTILEELEKAHPQNPRMLRARADAMISKLRIDFYLNSPPTDSAVKEIYGEALGLINRAIELEPHNPYNYNIKGLTLFINSKEDEKTLNLFKDANERDRNFLDPLCNIALLFFVNNREDKALEYSNLTLEINKENELATALKEIITNESLIKTLSSKSVKKTRPKTTIEEIPYSNDLAVEYITTFANLRKNITEKVIL